MGKNLFIITFLHSKTPSCLGSFITQKKADFHRLLYSVITFCYLLYKPYAILIDYLLHIQLYQTPVLYVGCVVEHKISITTP